MIVKDKFNLLKDVSNTLDLSQHEINSISIKKGNYRAFHSGKMERNITHPGADFIFRKVWEGQEGKPLFAFVLKPDYISPVSYNKPTEQIVINISYFGTDNIGTTNPDARNLYACEVYGYTFYSLITNQLQIKDNISKPVIDFIYSLVFRVFGKKYALQGSFSGEIPKLKFLIACYVLKSFFGFPQDNHLYMMASKAATFDYRDLDISLSDYDFSKLDVLIKSLSDFKAMPGFNKTQFTNGIMLTCGNEFLLGLEDLSRFLSLMQILTIRGSNIIKSKVPDFNKEAFKSLVSATKRLYDE